MLNSFTFNGINSLDYGLYITNAGVYDSPDRVVDMYSIPGRNGALAIDQGYFSNIQLKYSVYSIGDSQSDFAENIRDFRNELGTGYNYARLTDTYNAGEYRLALVSKGLEIKAPIDRHGSADITFECKPQRYLLTGEAEQTFTSNGSITNPTNFDSRPLLVVTGLGDLGIGGKTLTIEGASSSQVLYIDCDTQEAWTVSGGVISPANDAVQNAGAAFPTLPPGQSGISLGGTISQVKITPKWWRL